MGALKAQKRGAPPVFSSSRRKPTSKMAEAAAVTKYAIGDIVYVPLPPNFEWKSDLSKGKIISVSKVRCNCRGKGEMYWVMMWNLLKKELRFGRQSVCFQI